MLDHTPASPRPNWPALPALACLSALALIAGQASALPRVDVGAVPGFLLVQDPLHPGPEQEAQASLAELNQALEAMRAKLEELLVAAEAQRLQAVQTLQQDNERLAAELEQASTRATELECSNERAEARIAELTKAVEEASREAARFDEALAGQIVGRGAWARMAKSRAAPDGRAVMTAPDRARPRARRATHRRSRRCGAMVAVRVADGGEV